MTLSGEPCPTLSVLVGSRLEAIRARIEAAGGDLAEVRIVAVTKGFGPDAVRAALENGLFDIGENYPAELVQKQGALGPRAAQARWHFLGQIQRRQLQKLAGRVACYQGVDRAAEGEAIARHDPGAHVLIEIDTSGAVGRGGVAPHDAARLRADLDSLGLSVDGVMAIAPIGGHEVALRSFLEVAALADRLGLPTRSMGMSADLEAAVEAGSTMVRIGQALFGARRALGSVAE